MHHIYRTEVIVLSSRPSGEAGKYLTVLSKEYGILKIDAAAVRKNDSKLRQSIQDYSCSDISFVRGKTGNKLVNASFISSLYYEIHDTKVLKVLSRIFRLIEKMIIDEEQDNTVYGLLIKLADVLKNNSHCSEQFLKAIEVIVVYKILAGLGYLDTVGEHEFILIDDLNSDLVKKVEDLAMVDREKIIRLINQAINESHL